MALRVPLVAYLALEPEPHLIAWECRACGARFFGRRNACASCFGREFTEMPLETTGSLRTFTIVNHPTPGVEVPFVAGIVDCAGTSVAANVINTAPDPEHVMVGMKLRLATFSLGADDDGTEAIGFGFEPVDLIRERS